MDLNDVQTHEMLKLARVKAENLVKGLQEQLAEVDANPPAMDPARLTEGRQALVNALAAATRMLKALDEAQQIAATETN